MAQIKHHYDIENDPEDHKEHCEYDVENKLKRTLLVDITREISNTSKQKYAYDDDIEREITQIAESDVG